MLKKISQIVHPFEVDIARFFTTEPIASHPHNHCSPLIEVLELPGDPDHVILVTPLLREFDDPPFQFVGEVVECLRQVFEVGLGLLTTYNCSSNGLFLAGYSIHAQMPCSTSVNAHSTFCLFFFPTHSANSDCMELNIMMDPKPLYPNMFHPASTDSDLAYKGFAKHYSRIARPVKYYIIDFGISRRFNPAHGPPLELPIQGGDRSAPEILSSNGQALDPFPTDVYYLGSMINRNFLQVRSFLLFSTCTHSPFRLRADLSF